jgi:hypothetical protein
MACNEMAACFSIKLTQSLQRIGYDSELGHRQKNMKLATRIGDVFSATLDGDCKRYFQYVASDLTQLNSDVIRIFKKIYLISDNPNLIEIVNGEIEIYAHCVLKLGLKMKLWQKVGNTPNVGDTTQILFRDTNDYGSNSGENPILISHNWHVWRVNDRCFTRVGKLEGINRGAYIGIVINPLGILELLKGNKYPINYPEFE